MAYDNAALNQSIKGTTAGFQLGHNFWQGRNEKNTSVQLGLTVGYVQGSMDVSGDFVDVINGKAGTVDTDTTSLLAYYTLVNDKGTYIDAALQYSFSQAKAQGAQSSLSMDSDGLRASLEIGMPIYFINSSRQRP